MTALHDLIIEASNATAAALERARRDEQDETYDELFEVLRGLGRADRAIKQEVSS